jgi:GntR family transcriptional regulator
MAAASQARNDWPVRILDEHSETPVYVQLANALERRIRAGQLWDRGRQLPSKRELIEQFGVAPATVDKAIKKLRERGLVRGVQGKGVFAVPLEELPPPEKDR